MGIERVVEELQSLRVIQVCRFRDNGQLAGYDPPPPLSRRGVTPVLYHPLATFT
jgi:hypothetical protein